MKKGPLTEDAKNFAVLCFARFMTPTQVAKAVNERFGLAIDKRAAHRYDPTRSNGQKLGNKRKALFAEVRQRFLDELEQIPIAHRAVRLQQLQTHYDGALEKNNVGMGLRILEQAAKEAGNFHSNEKHVHMTGKLQVEDVTDEEMRGGIAAAIAQALDDARQPDVTKH